MSFMHFDAFTAATGVAVPSLSGTSMAPNMVYGVDEFNGVTIQTATSGWLFGTNDYSQAGPPFLSEQGSICSYQADYGLPAFYSYFNRSTEWISNKDYTTTYWIRATLDSGAAPSSGYTLGDWHSLAPTAPAAAQPFWTWSVSSKWAAGLAGSLKIEIARDNVGSVIFATGYYGGSATLVYGSGGGFGCFTGGMRILMADGTEKPIRDVQVGDMVKSLNTVTDKLIDVRVNDLMEPRGCNIYEIKMSNGKTIETTVDHPFRTANGDWVNIDPVEANKLGHLKVDCDQMKTGMVLRGANSNATVVKITPTNRKGKVYHLRDIGQYSNFFVEGMCVHNK